MLLQYQLLLTTVGNRLLLRDVLCYNRMKQNQTTIQHQDFLKFKAKCPCSRCENIVQRLHPEIFIDEELNRLRMNKRPASQQSCDLVVFFNNLRQSKAILPRLPLVDTIVMSEGAAIFAIYFEEGKSRILEHVSAKQWTIARKQQLDLRYQIRKYQQQNPGFTFSSFEHRSEKKIKQFENNIRYKMPSVLNRVAAVKLKHLQETALLSKNEFLDLFDSSKDKLYGMEQIEYIQVFPVMCGEEDYSYLRSIKYRRSRYSGRKCFKLAENYVSTWKERNDSLEKLEERVYEQICAHEKLPAVTEEIRLDYLSCKLLIYYEDVCNVRIEEAVLQFITNDQGKTFFFQRIECMRVERRALVDNVARELPTHKEYLPEEYIHLGTEMRVAFEGFQQQFDRVQRQRREMQAKTQKDKEYSNLVFNTVTQRRGGPSFHEILGGTVQRTKKKQLGL